MPRGAARRVTHLGRDVRPGTYQLWCALLTMACGEPAAERVIIEHGWNWGGASRDQDSRSSSRRSPARFRLAAPASAQSRLNDRQLIRTLGELVTNQRHRRRGLAQTRSTASADPIQSRKSRWRGTERPVAAYRRIGFSSSSAANSRFRTLGVMADAMHRRHHLTLPPTSVVGHGFIGWAQAVSNSASGMMQCAMLNDVPSRAAKVFALGLGENNCSSEAVA